MSPDRSTRRSMASLIPGCVTVIGFRPAPFARILRFSVLLPIVVVSRSFNSFMPAAMVFLCTPDMALISCIPPRPNEIASDARNFLLWSSSNHGSTRLMCSDNFVSIRTVWHIFGDCTCYLSIVPKERKIQKVTLAIQQRYGKNVMLKGMNFLDGATTRLRNGQIGGHAAEQPTPASSRAQNSADAHATSNDSASGSVGGDDL